MNVGEVCSRDVYIYKPEEPLAGAVAEMDRRHIGAIVAVEQRGDAVIPIGIVTDRDVIRGQMARRTDLLSLSIKDVMTANPLTVQEAAGVAEAIEQLSARGVRRAPVVNRAGDLVGIVSLDDLLPIVAEELGALARLVATQAMRERAIERTKKAPPGHIEQVGTIDPERRSSPVQSDPVQSFELLREQVGDELAGCYFNDARYAEGAVVLSGSTALRCERGIWVEAGRREPV